MRKVLSLLALCVLVSACGRMRDDLTEAPEPIGNFLMGYNITVANDPTKGPFSRDVTNEEWKAAVEGAIQNRLGRYDGDAWFHVAVGVQGYVVAMPGIPLIYSPKSVLVIGVTFIEDATQSKLNEEPIQMTVFEPCCTPILGSGLTRSREEQIDGLAFNAARAIERYMREHADKFGGVPEVLEDDPTIIEGTVSLETPTEVPQEPVN
ncbi:hypothetical protein [Marivivens donghaensis]|uniref:hypothetical protein n=1 Tax=Marivivens donghaensis TaxID=1699413 RepID=UPI00201F19A2|nr:hypothetical protein [Marivivens donghaensis]MCL7408645.1 hypothetical protein [Marivivens donghaensis]MDN3703312.1 hypothetical protein [Marivivens donghaensis]